MRIRLSGWNRLGIVISVLWVVLVISRVIYEYYTRTPFDDVFVIWVWTQTGNDYNVQFPHDPTNPFSAIPLAQDASVLVSFRFTQLAMWLLIPLGVLWLGSFATYWTVRWVHAGFKTKT